MPEGIRGLILRKKAIFKKTHLCNDEEVMQTCHAD
jgi:hypothetical protein